MSRLSRRTFLAGATAAAAGVALPPQTVAAALGRPADYVFLDPRFGLARTDSFLAAPLAPILVNADVTPVWNSLLSHARFNEPLSLRGATTESFYFCLRVLLQEHAQIETGVHRAPGDSYWWYANVVAPKPGRLNHG